MIRTTLDWHEGQIITKDKADILAHIIPARTHALGQSDVVTGLVSVSLPYGSSNQGHSAQFYDTYANRSLYWRGVLSQSLLLDPVDFSGLQ